MAFGIEIKRLREEVPISVQKLADAIGVDADRLRKWEINDSTPRFEDVQVIEAFFGKSLEEIMKLKSIKDFLKVPRATQKEESFQEKRMKSKNTFVPTLIPFLNIKAQAGYVKNYDQMQFMDTLERYSLPPGVDPRGAEWMYFEIEGDSMEPSFKEGDIILGSMVPLVDWQEIRNFYVYVIVTESSLCIKRLFRKTTEKWVMISDNEKEYEQEFVTVSEIKQLWVYRKTWHTNAKPPKKFEIKI